MDFIDFRDTKLENNGACAHYVMVSKFQWKPFWLATQRDPQNDWTATQNGVNYDVFAQAPLIPLNFTQTTSGQGQGGKRFLLLALSLDIDKGRRKSAKSSKTRIAPPGCPGEMEGQR